MYGALERTCTLYHPLRVSGSSWDQAVSGVIAGADTRSSQEATLDAVALANLWGWPDLWVLELLSARGTPLGLAKIQSALGSH